MVETMKNEQEMPELESYKAEAASLKGEIEEWADKNAEKVANFLSDVLSDENAKAVLWRWFDSLLSDGKMSVQDIDALKKKLQNLSNDANVIKKNWRNVSVDKWKLKQWIKLNLNGKQLNDFQKLASKMKEKGPR